MQITFALDPQTSFVSPVYNTSLNLHGRHFKSAPGSPTSYRDFFITISFFYGKYFLFPTWIETLFRINTHTIKNNKMEKSKHVRIVKGGVVEFMKSLLKVTFKGSNNWWVNLILSNGISAFLINRHHLYRTYPQKHVQYSNQNEHLSVGKPKTCIEHVTKWISSYIQNVNLNFRVTLLHHKVHIWVNPVSFGESVIVC